MVPRRAEQTRAHAKFAGGAVISSQMF